MSTKNIENGMFNMFDMFPSLYPENANSTTTCTDGKPHPDTGIEFIQEEDSKPIPNSITTHSATGSDDTEPGYYRFDLQTGQVKKIHYRDCESISTCKEKEKVNHPSHYNSGKIEVIDFIEDQKLGFHLGNAVKYICRAGRKDPDKIKEDLDKAIWYINRYKENIK